MDRKARHYRAREEYDIGDLCFDGEVSDSLHWQQSLSVRSGFDLNLKVFCASLSLSRFLLRLKF